MKDEEVKEVKAEKIGQEQIFDLITGKDVSWQSLIYELINTEQLDPWDIDLVVLSDKYLARVAEMEEANFFVSGKVLLAASLLLNIKAEILLDKEIQSLDDILFGRKNDDKKQPWERINIDYSELPKLYPRTPLPRLKKVSLQELMSALNQAISTENKRIRREVMKVRIEKDAEIVLPKASIKIGERIKKLYSKLLAMLTNQGKVKYHDLSGPGKEDKIACFLPVLHLDNQKKIFLEQEGHFEDIWIWLFKHYKNKIDISVKPSETYLADFFNLGEPAMS
jgi:segregation and condensation protein A